MRSPEPALRVVRAQLQFEVAEVAVQVAQAMAFSARSEQQVDVLTKRRDAAAQELRETMARLRIDPTLTATLHRLYQAERQSLQRARVRLATARREEQQLRGVLASVRNRERSIERALKAERSCQRRAQQARAIIEADDMWLQHAQREAL